MISKSARAASGSALPWSERAAFRAAAVPGSAAMAAASRASSAVLASKSRRTSASALATAGRGTDAETLPLDDGADQSGRQCEQDAAGQQPAPTDRSGPA